jgi:hypothetical protein
MPRQGTLFTFNRSTVMASGPRTAGVYGLWRDDRWIYIGESSNTFERLLEHLSSGEGCVASEQPSGFGFELIGAPLDRRSRQNELIQELAPACHHP